MRLVPLALAALLPATGCSALVANSGRQPEALSPWNATEIASAEPVVTGTERDGSTVTFHTRRKIAAPAVAYENAQSGILTFGLSELALLPWEVYHVTRATLFGSDVRIFSVQGTTMSVEVNGRRAYTRPSTPLNFCPPEQEAVKSREEAAAP